MNIISMLLRDGPRHVERSIFGWTAALFALVLAASPLAAAQDTDTDTLPTRVGRLSNATGTIYLAPPAHADDWSPIQVNYPVSSGDNVWAEEGARAEVDFGGSQMRMSAATNVNIANLDDHNLDVFVAQGEIIVRLDILDAGDSAVIDTPTTQIVLLRPGLYRIGVSPDQQQTTLTVRVGEATAQVTAGLQQVLPGMSAVIVNGPTTAADFSAAYPLDAFDTWSAERDRVYQQASNNNYVSPEMVGYADLASYGSWQANPDYGNVWYPNNVAAGWAPYSDGYWTTVDGYGLTWVDRAPWGYAPFHYGRWSYIRGRWGWLPGTYVARPVWAPALVAWTGGGLAVGIAGGAVYGWVPLGWSEPYRPWWRGCSGSCWDRYNRPYHVDERDRDRYRDHAPPPDRYANWRVPGAVSAVSGANLIARKPYSGNERVRLTSAQLSTAKPADSAPPIVKPSPNRIPVVRPGTRGTPKPASTFYATSKPAQMGLQRPGNGRLATGRNNAAPTTQRVTGAPEKTGQPAAGAPANRGDRARPTTRPAPGASTNSAAPVNQAPGKTPVTTAPSEPRNNAAPRSGSQPRNNNAAPRIVTPPSGNAAPSSGNGNAQAPRPRPESRIVNPPQTGATPEPRIRQPSRAQPEPRVQQAPRPQPEPRVQQAPRPQSEPRVQQAPRPQPEPRIQQAPRPQPEARAQQAPRPQPEARVQQAPRPQPEPRVQQAPRAQAPQQRAAPPQSAAKPEPRAPQGNHDRGRPEQRDDKDQQH